MKEVVGFRWRIKWGRRWVTTNHHCTEESIRREHPEATPEPHTRRVCQVPETQAESDAAMSRNSTGAGVGRRTRRDGTSMAWWENE